MTKIVISLGIINLQHCMELQRLPETFLLNFGQILMVGWLLYDFFSHLTVLEDCRANFLKINDNF